MAEALLSALVLVWFFNLISSASLRARYAAFPAAYFFL